MIKKSTEFSVIVDTDPSLNLETHTFFSRLCTPLLNNIPRDFRKYIKKSDLAAASVIDNVTNHDALETLYSKGKRFTNKNIFQKLFQKIWFNLNNSKAVRNRLKFVIRELHNHLEKISSSHKKINIISIASGSSRAIIEVVEKSHYLKNTELSITFLDKNPEAIIYSKTLSKNISHFNLQWIQDTVGHFFKTNTQEKYDVVEIVGLFDYFTDDKVGQILKNIYSILEDGGVVITAAINHNKEEKFITNVIGWTMIYRKAEKLAFLVEQAGFSRDNIKVFYEPLQIHGIVVAKK